MKPPSAEAHIQGYVVVVTTKSGRQLRDVRLMSQRELINALLFTLGKIKRARSPRRKLLVYAEGLRKLSDALLKSLAVEVSQEAQFQSKI